jgi:type III secretion protein D
MAASAIPMPRTLEPFTRAPQADAAPGWCLRFLNGEMKGRTIALKRGPNLLGSAGDCEVLLPGSEVLPRHLVFTVGEMVLTVQRMGTARARLNGDELAGQRRTVVAGDVVSIGPIDVQLDRSYPQARPAAGEEWPDSILPGDAVLQADEAAQPKSKGGYWVAGAALLLVLAGLLGVALIAGRNGGGAGSPGATLAELQKVVAGYPEVEVMAEPGGRYSLKGFVETPQRKQALLQAVAPHGRQVAVHVQTADEMVEQARRYLAAPGVTVDYAGRGRLVVSGTVEDESVRQRIRRLADDLQPSVSVSDKLQVRAPLVDRNVEQEKLWASWQGLLPARMVSITEDSNGLRYIQLANGNRLYEGALLRSGAELTRIENDRLVVTRQGAARPKEWP